jgi:hypothetical protein
MKRDKDQLREEYPEELIKSGVRGKHAKRFREGTNLVLIEPDLHEIFPDSDAVNRALRDYLTQRH